MRPLTVLITNFTLKGHSGTELYVRDLCRALMRRGCTPIVFSPTLGPLAERLSLESVPVVNDLRNVGETPDVIHGHHTLETLAALLHFPDTPAVFLCHDCDAWHDAPPKLRRVRRFIGVDQCCADRLTLAHGVPRERVSVLSNPVDLRLFQPRSPLPDRPRTALVFNGYLREPTIRPIREACSAMQVELQTLGDRFGRGTETPEQLLGNFDVVFARGRCAREAMAVGCAVVYCDVLGLGPLFNRAEIARQLATGRRLLLQDPLTAESVQRRLTEYNPADAAEVSAYIRQHHNLETTHDRLLETYEEAIAEHQHDDREYRNELCEVARMVEWWSTAREEMVTRRVRRNRPLSVMKRLLTTVAGKLLG